MKKPSTMKYILAAAAAALLTSQSAMALLTFDLRAPVINGAGVVSNGTKTVTVLEGNSVVTLDLWAVATGTDLNALNDGLGSTAGGMILSGPTAPTLGGINRDTLVAGNLGLNGVSASLQGNLAPVGLVNVNPNWGAGSVQATAGTARDLNGDGFADIGGSTSSNTGLGFVVLNAGGQKLAGGAPYNPGDFNLLANGVEFRVASYTFTITGGVASASTAVNFAVANFSSLNNNARAIWTKDGAGTTNGASAQLAVAGIVNISVVPEPSAFGMLAIGALGLVGFRRMGLRRSA